MGKLVPCKTCNKEVDHTAKSCPHCGVKKPGKKPSKFSLWWIVLGFFVFIVFFGGAKKNTPITPAPPSVTKASTTVEPPSPDAIKAARIKRIEQGFSAWSGEHRKLTELLKSSLKDPDSYEHEKTIYVDKGSYLVVITTYRAKNSFGALDLGMITAKTSIDGDVLEVINTK